MGRCKVFLIRAALLRRYTGYTGTVKWEFTGLLCWIDAAMSLLVTNTTLREHMQFKTGSLISSFFVSYRKILKGFNVNTRYITVRKILQNMREDILTFLQPKMLSRSGDEDSPLCSLPLVLKTEQSVYERLETTYNQHFKCDQCNFEKNDGFRRMFLSLPNNTSACHFVDNIFFIRSCYRCGAENQKVKLSIEQYPDVLYAYFENGTACHRYWKEYNFMTDNNERYLVTQVVQYQQQRHHFVLWSYSYRDKRWLQADDILHPVVSHDFKFPKCRPQEVHILVWEKESILKDLSEKVILSPAQHSVCEKTVNPLLTKLTSPPESWPSHLETIHAEDMHTSCNSSKQSSLSSTGTPDAESLPTPLFSIPFQNTLSSTPKMKLSEFQGIQRFEPYLPRSKRSGYNSIKKVSVETTPRKENLHCTESSRKIEQPLICLESGSASDHMYMSTSVDSSAVESKQLPTNNDLWNDLKCIMTEELNDKDDEFLLSPTTRETKISLNSVDDSMWEDNIDTAVCSSFDNKRHYSLEQYQSMIDMKVETSCNTSYSVPTIEVEVQPYHQATPAYAAS